MKKLLSVLLAVAMLVSFIPAVSAEEAKLEKSGVKVVYDMIGTINELGLMALGAEFNLKNIDYNSTLYNHISDRFVKLKYFSVENGIGINCFEVKKQTPNRHTNTT